MYGWMDGMPPACLSAVPHIHERGVGVVLVCVVALVDDQQVNQLQRQEGVLQQVHADLTRHHHHLEAHRAAQRTI